MSNHTVKILKTIADYKEWHKTIQVSACFIRAERGYVLKINLSHKPLFLFRAHGLCGTVFFIDVDDRVTFLRVHSGGGLDGILHGWQNLLRSWPSDIICEWLRIIKGNSDHPRKT